MNMGRKAKFAGKVASTLGQVSFGLVKGVYGVADASITPAVKAMAKPKFPMAPKFIAQLSMTHYRVALAKKLLPM